MRILVIGSCGKKKSIQTHNPPRCSELSSPSNIERWLKKHNHPSIRARDLYTGYQNRELVKGVDNLRKIKGVEVKYSIISAGFGLVDENDLLPAYDCTFSFMRKNQILLRTEMLGILTDFEALLETGFNLIYLALGKKYLLTLGSEWRKKTNTIILTFDRSLNQENVLVIPSDHKIVKDYSLKGYKIHGVTGFKGDLLRILTNYALRQKDPYRELLRWSNPVYLRDLILRFGNVKPLR